MPGGDAMSLEPLKEYETEFDGLMGQLPLWQLPIRPVLAALHMAVDGFFHGSRTKGGVAPRPAAGEALGARMSYLIPLIAKCPAEPLGRDGADALRAVREADPQGLYRCALLTYGHFSELMPEVHKGYYTVTGNKQEGFRLRHRSPEFAGYEARDILLTELSLTFLGDPPPRFTSRYDEIAKTAPAFDLAAMFRTIQQLQEHFLRHVREAPILTEEGYKAALGVGREDFERFRATLLAYAEYCRGMADACTRRLHKRARMHRLLRWKKPEKLTDVWNECIEWVSVCWKETFFLGTLQAVAKLPGPAIDRLMALYTVDFRQGAGAGANAGDGFLPPFARLGKAFVFNPDLVRLFLPARNVLYALNWTDKKTYDELVSKHLEPELLSAAVSLFGSFEGLALKTEYDWGPGEIDLLVYSPAENTALHVQAKAAIPPQGARLVKRVEDRMMEGVRQLKRLRQLPPAARDKVLSAALGREVRGVTVIDVLLSRACFGTEAVWKELVDRVPVNLTLLRIVLTKARRASAVLPLGSFPALVDAEFKRIQEAARPRFVEREVPLGATTFRLPLLDYSREAIWREQLDAWKAP